MNTQHFLSPSTIKFYDDRFTLFITWFPASFVIVFDNKEFRAPEYGHGYKSKDSFVLDVKELVWKIAGFYLLSEDIEPLGLELEIVMFEVYTLLEEYIEFRKELLS
jgi:hypothetical protein